MKSIGFFLLLLLLFTSGLAAQSSQHIVRGVVTEAVSLTPLEGVEIVARVSKLASGSQTDGVFTIPVTDKDSMLVFSFPGYETREVKLKGETDINIQLEKKSTNVLLADPAVLIGSWRGLFAVRPGVEVPFNFIISEDANGLSAALVNADERFPAGKLNIVGDSVFIPLPLFENELALSLKGNLLTGVLRRQDLRGNPLQLKAEKGQNYRFDENGSAPLKDISGNYRVVFQSPGGKEEQAVGIFRQKGNKVFATFLRVTGDSRYLEGNIEDNQLKLSAFIGSSPSYYTAIVQPDGSLKGETVNTRGGLPFTAIPDAGAALPDAYTLTNLKDAASAFTFSFPDAQGKMVSSADEGFKGKPLIVAIGGTWCPNCMDEAGFLGPWYKQNKQRGIEVISLQYERQTDLPYVKKAFERFQKHFGIEYTLLLCGVADKQAVVSSLPALQNFLSFPTTLFIDRYGKVQKIHTGFTGPATGEHYKAFVKEFNEEANKLIEK